MRKGSQHPQHPRDPRDPQARSQRAPPAAHLAAGDHLSAQFEDEQTIRGQIQEMLHTEKLLDEEGVQEETGTCLTLILSSIHWKATMLIEYSHEHEHEHDHEHKRSRASGACLASTLASPPRSRAMAVAAVTPTPTEAWRTTTT